MKTGQKTSFVMTFLVISIALGGEAHAWYKEPKDRTPPKQPSLEPKNPLPPQKVWPGGVEWVPGTHLPKLPDADLPEIPVPSRRPNRMDSFPGNRNLPTFPQPGSGFHPTPSYGPGSSFGTAPSFRPAPPVNLMPRKTFTPAPPQFNRY